MEVKELMIVNDTVKNTKDNQPDALEMHFEELLNYDSNKISLLMEQARKEEEKRNFLKSEFYYSEILKITNLTDFEKEETLYNLAYNEYALKKYDSAIIHFNSLLNTRFGNASLLYLIKLYLDLNNYDEAKIQLKKYIDSKGDINLLFQQGKDEVKNENFNNAKFYFTNLLEYNPSDSDLIHKLAKLESRQNNVDEAIFYFEKALKSEDHSLPNLLEIARLEETHDLEKASYYYNQILNINSNNLYAIYRLKKMNAKLDSNTDYSKRYDIISRERPEIICALDQINTYRNTHSLWMMFREFKQILYDNINYDNLYLRIGESMVISGNYELAKLFFDKCLYEKNEKNIKALLELGRLETKQGEFEKAKYYFNLANHIKTDYCLYELGLIKACEGNYGVARCYFKKMHNEIKSKIQLLNLDIKEQKYDDAYRSYSKLGELLNNKRQNFNDDYDVFLKIKLGLFKWDRNANYNYFANQLIDYNEDLTLKHVEQHRISKEADKKYNGFSNDIDLKKLIDFSSMKIVDLYPIEFSLIDKYIIEYDDYISNFSGKDTKYLEAVTLPNSNKILTLYPVLKSEESK